jgi:hypothetical protein
MTDFNNLDYVWWEAPSSDDYHSEEFVEECRANSLIEHMRSLEETQKEVHRQNLFNYQLYSNRYLSCFDWGTGLLTAASLAPVSQTTDNGILEVVDAMLSEIGKVRPKIKPIGHNASWKTRRNITKLDKFLYGEFVREHYWEKQKDLLLNAEVCNFGAFHVSLKKTKQGAKSCIESVFPDDILIDQQEVIATKKIWTIIHRRVLPLDVVASTWNIPKEELANAATQSDTYLSYRTKSKDFIVVGTAWRAGCDGVPGRKVTAIKDRILEDESWEHEWLPWVFFHYSRPLQGFYSASLVEQILPDQIRLNEINDVIEEAQNIMCGPRLLAQKGSQLNPQVLDNIIGKVVYYTGNEPKAVTWPAVAAELYQERDRRKANMFTKAGLNQTTASGQLPGAARLDSSPAVREYSAIQDGRLADITQRLEKVAESVAKTIINVIKASGEDVETIWYSGPKKSKTEKIKWSEINLEEEDYTMILEVASSFSMTPSAIRDDLEAQLARGEITPERYRQQIQSPDPDNETSILTAAAENVDWVIEQCEDGKLVSIIPQMDLVSLEQRATLAMLNLDKYEDVPVEVREAFIDVIEQCKMWSQQGMETDPMMEAAPPVGMPAMPVPGGQGVGAVAPPMM